MIKPHAYHEMHINEKGNFADVVLAAVTPYCDNDADLAPLVAAVRAKNELLSQALQKVSLAEINKLLKEADALRDHGIVNLRDYAQACAARQNATWAQAGQLLVNAIKQTGWLMNRKGNKEETQLIDTLLAELDTQPKLREAIATINGQEWVEEIREGHASYKEYDMLRTSAQKSHDAVSSRQAAQEVGKAINKLFRYINFQIEFKASEPYMNLASRLNVTILHARATLKQRATVRKNRKAKNRGIIQEEE